MKGATTTLFLPSKSTSLKITESIMKYFLLLFFSFVLLNASQEPKRTMKTFSSDNAVIIREVGAVIIEKNNKLVVEMLLGNNHEQTSDIQKDDEVLMANGKKIKSIGDLRAQYEQAKAGDEIKMGLKRNENLLIARFAKKSDEELNNAGGGFVMRMEKKEGEEILPALGLGFLTKNNAVIVNNVLPTAEKHFKSFMPKAGDVIISINEKTVSTAEAFVEMYDALAQGDSVTLVFARNGKENKETFSKPKPMGRMIFNRK